LGQRHGAFVRGSGVNAARRLWCNVSSIPSDSKKFVVLSPMPVPLWIEHVY
jgi:hypothetical protein